MSLIVFSRMMSMIYYMFAVSYLYCRLLAPRKNIPHIFWVCCLMMIADPVVVFIDYEKTMYFHWICIMLPLIFLFRDSVYKRIICYITIYFTMMFCELMGFLLSCSILSLASGKIQVPNDLDGPQSLVALVCIIFAGTLVLRFLTPSLKKILLYVENSSVFLIGAPILFCTILHPPMEINQQPPYVAIPAYLFCYLFLYLGFQRIHSMEMLRQQREHQKTLMEKQLSYSRELEKEYQELRKWNHDIANHFLALSFLLESEKYQECETYITRLLEESHSE